MNVSNARYDRDDEKKRTEPLPPPLRIIKEVKSKTNSREGLPSINGDILMPGSTTTVGIDLATASALQQNNVLLGGDLIVIRKKEPNNYKLPLLGFGSETSVW